VSTVALLEWFAFAGKELRLVLTVLSACAAAAAWSSCLITYPTFML
jgi:hypothetical protein